MTPKTKGILLDPETIQALDHLERSLPGGFKATKFFRDKVQEEAKKYGWTNKTEQMKARMISDSDDIII